MAKSSEALSLLQRGQFQSVLDLYRADQIGKTENEQIAVLGSLAFSGDAKLLEELTKRWIPGFGAEAHAVALHYRSLAFIRASRYDESKQTLVELFRWVRRHTIPRESAAGYGAYQSLAFFHFFTGRYRLAKRYARRALTIAVVTKAPFGEALSLDLLGHTQVQLGEIREGLRDFEKAARVCTQMELSALGDSIRFSVAQAEAFYGLKPATALRDGERALRKLTPSNTFANGELLLELARQHQLRGNFREAEAKLEAAAEHILRTENRRQLGKLNVAIATLARNRGQRLASLSPLHNARKHLDPKVDRALLAIVEGALYEIRPEPELARRLVASARASRGALQRRHLARLGLWPADDLPERGQDKLGDLIEDLRAGSRKAFHAALANGYYGLLRHYFRSPPQQRVLVTDNEQTQFWALEPDSIRPLDFGQSQILRSCLRELLRGPRRKLELTEAIWGVAYHPHQNDPAFFRAMTRLKAQLNAFTPWILSEGDHYRLAQDIVVRNAEAPSEAKPSSPEHDAAERPAPTPFANAPTEIPLRARLTRRQQRALEEAERRGEIGAPQLAKLCRVTRMTAYRDLHELCRLGLLFVSGRARQTRYRLVETPDQGPHKGRAPTKKRSRRET